MEALCDAHDEDDDEDDDDNEEEEKEEKDEDDDEEKEVCFFYRNQGNTLFCFKEGDILDCDYMAHVVELEVEMLWD